ncbi:MAG TPA: hypothetical protein VL485_32235 [Ktedonobacteraceae bacterium]|jgi:hypothetical protein|nr:hypothetical protein [Ktedonobacteraceae bacterium]
MNFDPAQLNQLVNSIQFPIKKAQVIQLARQRGMNDQLVNMLDQNLPDELFSSAQELQSKMSGVMGKLKGMGGGMGKMGDVGGGMKS